MMILWQTGLFPYTDLIKMLQELTFFWIILQDVTHVLIKFLKVSISVTGLLSLLNRSLKYKKKLSYFWTFFFFQFHYIDSKINKWKLSEKWVSLGNSKITVNGNMIFKLQGIFNKKRRKKVNKKRQSHFAILATLKFSFVMWHKCFRM